MNQDTNTPDINRASGAAVGFVIASGIFVVLMVVVKLSTCPPAIDADRAAAISQSLSEIRSNEVVSLNSAGWIDRPHGVVRLPIDAAMQLAAQAWQNPSQARADLIARSRKATAPLPKPAATANPFE